MQCDVGARVSAPAIARCPGGETGRRWGLKTPWRKLHAGSTPAPGTYCSIAIAVLVVWIQIALPDERGLCHAFERLSAREQVHNLFLRISPHIYLFLTDNITRNILVSARVQRDRNPT